MHCKESIQMQSQSTQSDTEVKNGGDVGGKGSRRGLQSRQHLRQRESHYELSP